MNLSAIKEFLCEEGFRATLDDDNDIIFKYEGKTLFIESYESDSVFIRIVLPNIWSADSEAERQQAYVCANNVNYEYKVVKAVLTAHDNINLTLELFLPNEHAFIAVFERSLTALNSAHRAFAEAISNYSESKEKQPILLN
ncbi:MAG: YbjN domain-containing protein [Pseudomonadales bacterium]|nr:YbjN domain-containing protein [Pseudomonadales bacterium]